MNGSSQAGKRTPPAPSLFIRVLRWAISWFANVIVVGAENLDTPGGKVVVCNHVGWADPLWVGYAALPRHVNQMAKKELFDNPISGWFVRSGGGFPVERSRPSAATIKHAISLVEQDGLLLIFPVGTRKRGSAEAKRGAATIAIHANAQVLPAHYDGPSEIKFSHLWRKPTIRITFGMPFSAELEAVTTKQEVALKLTAALDRAMDGLAQSSELQGLPIGKPVSTSWPSGSKAAISDI